MRLGFDSKREGIPSSSKSSLRPNHTYCWRGDLETWKPCICFLPRHKDKCSANIVRNCRKNASQNRWSCDSRGLPNKIRCKPCIIDKKGKIAASFFSCDLIKYSPHCSEERDVLIVQLGQIDPDWNDLRHGLTQLCDIPDKLCQACLVSRSIGVASSVTKEKKSIQCSWRISLRLHRY